MATRIGYAFPPSPAEAVELPEIPAWLETELRANPVFVQEAIENGGVCNALANAWLGRGTYGDAIERAVAAWVAHWWHFGDYDAAHIQRVWMELEREVALRAAA
jgi:hypothetical protein